MIPPRHAQLPIGPLMRPIIDTMPHYETPMNTYLPTYSNGHSFLSLRVHYIPLIVTTPFIVLSTFQSRLPLSIRHVDTCSRTPSTPPCSPKPSRKLRRGRDALWRVRSSQSKRSQRCPELLQSPCLKLSVTRGAASARGRSRNASG